MVFLSPKLLKFGEIKGVKFMAWKSGGAKFLTNLMSGSLSFLMLLLSFWYFPYLWGPDDFQFHMMLNCFTFDRYCNRILSLSISSECGWCEKDRQIGIPPLPFSPLHQSWWHNDQKKAILLKLIKEQWQVWNHHW